ncbi:MAG: SDR family oxidoreductase [Pseudomonadota bacterium]
MDLGLAGKVAIVTGGSEGIGRAAAQRMSAEGARVALVARTQADLDRVAAEMSAETGHEVIGVAADMRDEAAVKAMVDAVVARFGGIDILVNNAGTAIATRFEDMTNDLLDEDFSLKVKGAVYATRHAYPYLKDGGGAICNTTTPGGKTARAGSQPTSLSRAAGISLTKAWASEFAADGVRVNTICVGMFKSRQHRRRWESKNADDSSYTLDDHWAGLARGVPMGRVGEASEAGDVIAFLCSERASFVTGTAINVDGGAAPVI